MSGPGIYRIFWLGVLGAVVAVGAPMVGKPAAAIRLVDHERNSSVNSILEQTLGEPGLPDRITEWLAKLTPGRPILLLAPPNNNPAAIAADTITYLAWPRPVVFSHDPEKTKQLMQGFRERYAAVGLCYMSTPPGFNQGKTFGLALRFIPSAPVPE